MTSKVSLKSANSVFEKFLSKEEIRDAITEADDEMKVLQQMLDDVSKFATELMAEKNIGFRAFAREQDLSLSMATKILKGAGNLTLETVAHLAAKNGHKVKIEFVPE